MDFLPQNSEHRKTGDWKELLSRGCSQVAESTTRKNSKEWYWIWVSHCHREGRETLGKGFPLFCIWTPKKKKKNQLRNYETHLIFFSILLRILFSRFICFMYTCVCLSLCVPHVPRTPWKPEEGGASPGTGVPGSCKLPSGWKESNPGPLQEK